MQQGNPLLSLCKQLPITQMSLSFSSTLAVTQQSQCSLILESVMHCSCSRTASKVGILPQRSLAL